MLTLFKDQLFPLTLVYVDKYAQMMLVNKRKMTNYLYGSMSTRTLFVPILFLRSLLVFDKYTKKGTVRVMQS